MVNSKVYNNGDIVGIRTNGDGETFTWRIRQVESLVVLTVQSNVGWDYQERLQSSTDLSQFTLTPEFLNSAYIQYLANTATLNKAGIPANEALSSQYTKDGGAILLIQGATTPFQTITDGKGTGTGTGTAPAPAPSGINTTYIVAGAIAVVVLLIFMKK